MKSFLIIPMGGTGKRFIKKGYKTYKSLLPINSKSNIFENIKKNFESGTHVIVLGSSIRLEKYFKNKTNCSFIKIPKHKKGPLYSIYLSLEKINLIIGKSQNIFISYTDINWKWKAKEYTNILKKKVCVLTHKGFHPHLEVNQNSDFCKINKNYVLKISEKKANYLDYKIDNLAIGCYFFKNLNYINYFFTNFNIENFKIKKEFYLLSLINFLIKKKIKVEKFNIERFVHLGTPEQYEDYIDWYNKFKYGLKKLTLKNNKSIMLMCGKGKRVKNLGQKKPFLKIENEEFYKLIFKKFNSVNKTIITTQKYLNQIDRKKYDIYKIKQTSSMFETIYSSKDFFFQNSKFFLLSCDCFGEINSFKFKKLIESKVDLIIFAFKKTYLNSALQSSHTSLTISKDKIKEIYVKTDIPKSYGHAGFFWINSPRVFKYLNNFKKSKNFKNLSFKREIIIDDYFRYLLKNKLINLKCINLNNYWHLGSVKEFKEYIYWKKYFNNEISK